MTYLTCPDCAAVLPWPSCREGHTATPLTLRCPHCGREHVLCVDVEQASELLCGAVGERTGRDAEGVEW